jgi:hypothetical protein
MVGRTGATTSDFVVPVLDRRWALDCSTRFSFRTGSAGTASDLAFWGLDSRLAVVASIRGWFVSRSPASAPAIRICSTVGKVDADFFARTRAFAGVAFPDSESDGCDSGAARSVAFGLVSRPTTTSCPRICPARANPHSKAVKAFVPINAAVINEFSAIGKPLNSNTHAYPVCCFADHWTTLSTYPIETCPRRPYAIHRQRSHHPAHEQRQ